MDVPAGNALPDPYGGAAQAAYPWRGRMTVDPGLDRTAAARTAVQRFAGLARAQDFAVSGNRVTYTGRVEWSFRRMVLHQAHLALAAGGVDAFVIGSEMRGLVRLRDENGGFPFVEALMALASEVKTLLPETKITYAADWSEYFGYQPTDGSGDLFYNLDPLWAHPAIDMVGIDNYLSLTDWRVEDSDGSGPDAAASPYDMGAISRGIASGEYADWYYASPADREARRRTAITDGAAGKPWVFRPKDLVNWWGRPHVERRGGIEVGEATAWVPASKPIWFTEIGCPAIDKGANQPNVFLDPKSSESFAPHFSTGAPDDLIQRRFLTAQLRHWDPALPGFQPVQNPVSPIYGGRMVDPAALHVWTWDTRPFPAFPERSDIWSDGANWRRGHWLTGRLGRAPLAELIRQLLAEHGITDVDTSRVDALVGGYLLSGPGSARAELEELMRLCGITGQASGGRLVFASLDRVLVSRTLDVLAEEGEGGALIERRRMEDSETPEEVVVGYSDRARSYQTAAAEAVRSRKAHPRKTTIELPVVLDEWEARGFASAVLAREAEGRETIRFSASPTEIGLEPGDAVTLGEVPGRFLITRIEDGMTRRIEARRIADAARQPADERSLVPAPAPKGPVTVSQPIAVFLDLPLGDAVAPAGAARLAVHARPFVPVRAEMSVSGGSFRTAALVKAPATMGILARSLAAGPEGLIDRARTIEVELFRGALASISEALLAGQNLCAVRCRSGGIEVIQFQDAVEVAPGRFQLGRLLRAQGGTEDAMASGADVGADFVLLDEATNSLDLTHDQVGRAMDWRLVPIGRALDDPAVLRRSGVALGGRATLPLSPVHLKARFSPDGAVRVDFVRRTRTGGDGWDGIDVPLGEDIERYRLRLLADDRMLAVETAVPQATISAADQIAAFGGLPARLGVEVCQFSLTAGAGLSRGATVHRPV